MFEVGEDTGDSPGEFQYWVERDHLDQVFPLPAAYHAVRMNRDGELAVLTGQGTAHAAATIMALGLDPRFDLSHAYWVVRLLLFILSTPVLTQRSSLMFFVPWCCRLFPCPESSSWSPY